LLDTHAARARSPVLFLTKIYAIQGLGSIAANLLMYGIFFYMHDVFGWGAHQNLPLSSAQGALYVIGALAANPLSRHFDRQRLLRGLHFFMMLFAIACAFATPSAIVPLLLAYVALSACQWPLLESLISIGAAPAALSRRISIYNLCWSGTAAATYATCGLIIAHHPLGIFYLAATVHALSVLSLLNLPKHPPRRGGSPLESSEIQIDSPHPHLTPEPELIPLRTLAKNLSRIVLPATFAVIYALGAIMPTLKVIRAATPSTATLLASVWMMARFLCFLFLGLTVWWHTRPRALLLAAAVTLAAFLGVTLIPIVSSMILWQIAMGLAMGLIYSASLYFGTVLSDGATAQNAYHEALIGVGSILGPGCGALALFLFPKNPHASITAVALILSLSLLAAALSSIRWRRKSRSAQTLAAHV
jgi:MFS family permease